MTRAGEAQPTVGRFVYRAESVRCECESCGLRFFVSPLKLADAIAQHLDAMDAKVTHHLADRVQQSRRDVFALRCLPYVRSGQTEDNDNAFVRGVRVHVESSNALPKPVRGRPGRLFSDPDRHG